MKGTYDRGEQGFSTAEINWPAADVRAILIDNASYTPDFAADEFLSDIAAPAQVAISVPLTGKTAVGRVIDADDVTWTNVSGAISDACVLYLHTGNPATSILIWFDDEGAGFPVTPVGDDITYRFDPAGILTRGNP
jgi:hypothetical protein